MIGGCGRPPGRAIPDTVDRLVCAGARTSTYQPHLRAKTASGLPPRQVEFPPPGAAAVCPGPGRFRAQSSGPPHQSNDQDDEQQEKDQEQDPGNLHGAGRDAGKAEQPGDQRDDKKYNGTAQHCDPLISFRWIPAAPIAASMEMAEPARRRWWRPWLRLLWLPETDDRFRQAVIRRLITESLYPRIAEPTAGSSTRSRSSLPALNCGRCFSGSRC